MSNESVAETPAFWSEPERRVPRIALMGEFSAGKSTLANLMIGTNPLPVQVVATQMPPVWISHGEAPSVIVDLEGQEKPCDLNTLQGLDPEQTAFIKFFCNEEILTQCDIIDMPGISDPNMSSDVWERVLPFADAVVWCTPATQAWRQSEAAVWSGIDEEIKRNSILVVTRADMLTTEKDRTKVRKRIEMETKDLFSEVIMMSLTQAQNVDQDEALWEESGADAFVASFMERVARIQSRIDGPSAGLDQAPASVAQDVAASGGAGAHVMPRRPVVRSKSARGPEDAAVHTQNVSADLPKFS